MIERISIEPTRRCSKGCAFCYNGSNPSGQGEWREDEVVAFAEDCARAGVRAISFGGGEPLEWGGLFGTLERLRGVLFRSLTTNGLLLDIERLARAQPDKVHMSIHAPENVHEVERVIQQVKALENAGLKSGVNLLVRKSRLSAAREATKKLHDASIDNARIVHLPMRGQDTPAAEEVAAVAGARFQSMTCLAACGKSARFASIAADRTVAWCSYTRSRRPLAALDFASLVSALDGLDLEPCANGLVKLGPRTIADA